MREQRLIQVQEELKEIELQLGYVSRHRERCANVNNFPKAIEMSKEMEELRQKKRKYLEEVALLQKKGSLNKRVKKCLEKKRKTCATNLPEGNNQSIQNFLSKDIRSTSPSVASPGKEEFIFDELESRQQLPVDEDGVDNHEDTKQTTKGSFTSPKKDGTVTTNCDKASNPTEKVLESEEGFCQIPLVYKELGEVSQW